MGVYMHINWQAISTNKVIYIYTCFKSLIFLKYFKFHYKISYGYYKKYDKEKKLDKIIFFFHLINFNLIQKFSIYAYSIKFIEGKNRNISNKN